LDELRGEKRRTEGRVKITKGTRVKAFFVGGLWLYMSSENCWQVFNSSRKKDRHE
jgi:hypothetical protein